MHLPYILPSHILHGIEGEVILVLALTQSKLCLQRHTHNLNTCFLVKMFMWCFSLIVITRAMAHAYDDIKNPRSHVFEVTPFMSVYRCVLIFVVLAC